KSKKRGKALSSQWLTWAATWRAPSLPSGATGFCFLHPRLVFHRSEKPLRTLHDLQRLRALESPAKDGVPAGDFGNGIGMDHIGAIGERVAEGNLKVGSARFQRKMLVADCRRPPIFGDGHDDDGQIEGFGGTIGDLDDAVDPVVADLWRLKP